MRKRATWIVSGFVAAIVVAAAVNAVLPRSHAKAGSTSAAAEATGTTTGFPPCREDQLALRIEKAAFVDRPGLFGEPRT